MVYKRQLVIFVKFYHEKIKEDAPKMGRDLNFTVSLISHTAYRPADQPASQPASQPPMPHAAVIRARRPSPVVRLSAALEDASCGAKDAWIMGTLSATSCRREGMGEAAKVRRASTRARMGSADSNPVEIKYNRRCRRRRRRRDIPRIMTIHAML